MLGRKRFEVPSKYVNPLYTFELEQIHRVRWIALAIAANPDLR